MPFYFLASPCAAISLQAGSDWGDSRDQLIKAGRICAKDAPLEQWLDIEKPGQWLSPV